MKSEVLTLLVLSNALLLTAAQGDDGDSAGPAVELAVYDHQNAPCVLMRINATIEIEPKRTANKKYNVEVPRYAIAKGQCGNGMDSRMLITWGNSFRLNWHFQKCCWISTFSTFHPRLDIQWKKWTKWMNPKGRSFARGSHVSDAWYVDQIIFSYNTAEKLFNEAEGAGEVHEIRSPDSFTLWLTPTGQAYSCSITQEIKLLDMKKHRRVTIMLKQIKIQPFGTITRHQYGDAFVCPEEAGRRNETVPIAVGSTLAIVVLLTIGIYAGYRYFKVKKIEYDTME